MVTKLNQRQRMILQAVKSRPGQWLNCHGDYLGDVLSLQCQGLITSRIEGNQLQVRTRDH